MNTKALLASLLLLCFSAQGLPQTTDQDDVVKINTNLVQIDAVVTKNGKLVPDLKAEDFEIFQDGKRQTITSFAYVSNVSNNAGSRPTPGTSGKNPNVNADPNSPAPPQSEIARRRIAFVVDDYGLSAQSMADIRSQLRKFIDEQLSPDDLIAIVLTSRATRELLQLTNDRSRIDQAWEQLRWHQCSRVGLKTMPRLGDDAPSGCGPNIATFPMSINSIRTIVTALGQMPGRKSMVVFSNDTPLRENEELARGSSSVMEADGGTGKDSNNYSARLRRLAELAIRSSVVIYAVDATGLQTTSLTAADFIPTPMISGSQGNRLFVQQMRARWELIQSRREGAALIAKATGGFLVQDQNEFQFDKILEDQSGYYVIGYRPTEETFNKQFHKIRARVNKPGYEVRTRSGFFGMSEEEAKRLKEKKK
jgi:VWFA-related protein